jgi:tetratricopeptide (TPR) repeat protein
LLGEEHSDTLTATENLGVSYLYQLNYAQAGPLLAGALEIRRRVLGEEHPDTLRNTNFLASVYLGQREYPQTERLLRPALSVYEKTAADSWLRFNTESQLGASLAGQRKYEEAEPLLVAGYGGLFQRATSIPAGRRSELENSGTRLIQLYQDWGKPEKAAEWSKKIQTIGNGVTPK